MTKFMELEEIMAHADELQAEYERVKKSTPYAKTIAKRNRLYEKIEKMEERIKVLQEKAKKQFKKHCELVDSTPAGCYADRIKLIGEELLKRNPQFKSYYVIGVFGLNRECSLWFYEDELGYTPDLERIKASLTFHHGGQNRIRVWTGETTNEYPKGSIGELNGENQVMVDVTSIDQLNKMLNEDYTERLS